MEKAAETGPDALGQTSANGLEHHHKSKPKRENQCVFSHTYNSLIFKEK